MTMSSQGCFQYITVVPIYQGTPPLPPFLRQAGQNLYYVMIPTCLLLFLLLSVLKVATLARARTINFTVDDQDPEIDYFPRSSWQTVDALDVDFGGSHMFTSDVDGYAEIKKTCVSFRISKFFSHLTKGKKLPFSYFFLHHICPLSHPNHGKHRTGRCADWEN